MVMPLRQCRGQPGDRTLRQQNVHADPVQPAVRGTEIILHVGHDHGRARDI